MVWHRCPFLSQPAPRDCSWLIHALRPNCYLRSGEFAELGEEGGGTGPTGAVVGPGGCQLTWPWLEAAAGVGWRTGLAEQVLREQDNQPRGNWHWDGAGWGRQTGSRGRGTEPSSCARPHRPQSLETGGTGLSRQLLQQALMLLTNARVERRPCASSLPLGPTTNKGLLPTPQLQQCLRVLLPSTGTPGAGAGGTAARSHAGASQQHPSSEPSHLCSSEVWARRARLHPRQTHPQQTGFPCCHQGRAGWVNLPLRQFPVLAGIISAQGRFQRQTIALAPLFRQSSWGRGARQPSLRPGFRLEALGPFQGC